MSWQPTITIVVPNRIGQRPDATITSLYEQTFQDFIVVIVNDAGRGAPWARNRGARLVETPYLLFSDNDIRWRPGALSLLLQTLENHPAAAYSYGSYLLDGHEIAARPFDADRLWRRNYISTMSLLRTREFPGFDENLHRLQDWDLWLGLLARGKPGAFCGQILFETVSRADGISQPGRNMAAVAAIRRKWGPP